MKKIIMTLTMILALTATVFAWTTLPDGTKCFYFGTYYSEDAAAAKVAKAMEDMKVVRYGEITKADEKLLDSWLDEFSQIPGAVYAINKAKSDVWYFIWYVSDDEIKVFKAKETK